MAQPDPQPSADPEFDELYFCDHSPRTPVYDHSDTPSWWLCRCGNHVPPPEEKKP